MRKILFNKKWTTLVVIAFLCVLSIGLVFFTSQNIRLEASATNYSELTVFEQHLGRDYSVEYSLDTTTGERIDIRVNRTICISEDFCDRTIIVTLRQAYSIPNNAISARDFAVASQREQQAEQANGFTENIAFSRIDDLTYFTNEVLDMRSFAANDVSENSNIGFNQILSLELMEYGKQNVLDMIYELERLDKVLAAEPSFNFEAFSNATNEEPEINELITAMTTSDHWALNITKTPSAWAFTRGAGVRIGIMDSGVRTHTSFGNRLLAGNSPNNDNIHGTRVAGNAAGANTGVAPLAQIVPLNWNSGQFINTMTFARNNQIRIVNASFFWGTDGDPNTFRPTTNQVNAVRNFDGLFVGTSGNANVDFTTRREYPAAMGTSFGLTNVIIVGASTATDARWANSNWGRATVCIFAPGANVSSTAANNAYQNWSGTSAAAPHVAGTAALMLAVNPTLTGAQMRTLIRNNGDQVNAFADISITGRRLNTHRTVASAAFATTNVSGGISVGLRAGLTLPANSNMVIPERIAPVGATAQQTVVAIAANAFANQTTLTQITIPATVREIGDFAFFGTSNLRSITNLRPIPQQINSGTFGSTIGQLLRVFVPAYSITDYRRAGWSMVRFPRMSAMPPTFMEHFIDSTQGTVFLADRLNYCGDLNAYLQFGILPRGVVIELDICLLGHEIKIFNSDHVNVYQHTPYLSADKNGNLLISDRILFEPQSGSRYFMIITNFDNAHRSRAVNIRVGAVNANVTASNHSRRYIGYGGWLEKTFAWEDTVSSAGFLSFSFSYTATFSSNIFGFSAYDADWITELTITTFDGELIYTTRQGLPRGRFSVVEGTTYVISFAGIICPSGMWFRLGDVAR